MVPNKRLAICKVVVQKKKNYCITQSHKTKKEPGIKRNQTVNPNFQTRTRYEQSITELHPEDRVTPEILDDSNTHVYKCCVFNLKCVSYFKSILIQDHISKVSVSYRSQHGLKQIFWI